MCFFCMASWLDEIDMWICGMFSWGGRCLEWLWLLVFQKNSTHPYLESLYTIVTLLLLSPFFFNSFFFCLKFYFYLKIHIVDCLMYLQWPFACKDRIHQGKCSTNNWWVVRTRSEAFKKAGIQWVWPLTVRKSPHLPLLCTSVPVVQTGTGTPYFKV